MGGEENFHGKRTYGKFRTEEQINAEFGDAETEEKRAARDESLRIAKFMRSLGFSTSKEVCAMEYVMDNHHCAPATCTMGDMSDPKLTPDELSKKKRKYVACDVDC